MITRQPGWVAAFCHCSASAESSRAIAGAGCARTAVAARLTAAQARADLLNQLFDVIRLFQSRQRENEPVVLFEILLQLLGQVNQQCGVLQVLLVLGLEEFLSLRFAVGEP